LSVSFPEPVYAANQHYLWLSLPRRGAVDQDEKLADQFQGVRPQEKLLKLLEEQKNECCPVAKEAIQQEEADSKPPYPLQNEEPFETALAMSYRYPKNDSPLKTLGDAFSLL
jgi:hypothetical protein